MFNVREILINVMVNVRQDCLFAKPVGLPRQAEISLLNFLSLFTFLDLLLH